MKKGWEVKNFEDCLEKIVYTNKIKRKDFLETGKYPIISQEQEFVNGYWNDSKDLFKVKKPVIIFGDHTHVLKYLEFDFVLGADGVKILQPISDLNPKYFYYFMINIKFKKLGYARHYRLLKEISIPLPPLPEQQRIAAILDEAFDAIAIAKVNAEKNLQNAHELFELFMESVFVNPGEGWEKKTMGNIAEFRNGINYTKDSKGEKVKIVGVKDFQKNYWIPLENLDIVTIDGKLGERDYLKQDDILAVRSNGNQELIGRCILARGVAEKISHSGFTIRIRKTSNDISPQYLCHYLKSQKARKHFVESGTGVNIKSLNQVTLSSLAISYPSLPEQQRIVSKLDALSTETKKLEAIYQRKLADLDELKKSILQKAFNGELTS